MTDLVVCSLEPWDEVWRRNQYLVAGLLRRDPGLRVLFVEPPADPLHAFVSRRRPSRGAGLRLLPDLPGVGRGMLWLHQPTKILPRSVSGEVDARLAGSVVRAARRIGFSHPLLWVNNPSGAALVARTGWPALYDITDDWLSARRSPRECARLAADEAALLDRCVAVTVCSPRLAATKGVTRPVHLVPNAVDSARYRAPQPRPADMPTGSVALYVGTVHTDRMDIALCTALAASLRALVATVVLVGPAPLSSADRASMEAAGVRLIGARAFESIPGYLQHADVLIVPHVVDDFTDSLDPIKLYEYLAVGRPVVTTPVAGFRDLDGHGVVVAAGEEFIAAVVQALHDPTLPAGPLPMKVTVPTWDERVQQMANVLSTVAKTR
jgi:teichuronic acid biosynthesis glycosyltransferase TuaH